MARRVASEPARLADDFKTWMAASHWDRQKYKAGCKARPKAAQSNRALFLASVSLPIITPNSSPNSSFSSTSSTSPTPTSLSTRFSNQFFQVRESSKGGFGAFAIKAVPGGTVIIAEKALFRCRLYDEVPWAVESLPTKLQKEYKRLHHWAGIDKDQVYGIFKTNRFETSDSQSGIFLNCSRFNHACHPHTTCTYTWNKEQEKLIVTTLRDVAAGEELTISYMGHRVNHCLLKYNYGFDCDCPGCLPEKVVEAEVEDLVVVERK